MASASNDRRRDGVSTSSTKLGWLIFATVLCAGLVVGALWKAEGRKTQAADNSGAVVAARGCAGAQIGVLAAPRSNESMSIRQAVPPATSTPSVTGTDACSKAEKSFGGADAPSTQVELSLYSDDVFGGTAGKNLKYQDVLAWVVTFKGGRCLSAGSLGEFGPGTLVTAIDAVTGEVLNGHYECPPG
jgi:hypothetical protein